MLSKLEKLYKYYKGKIPDVDQGHLSYAFRHREQIKLNEKTDPKEFEKRVNEIEEQLKLLGLNTIAINIVLDHYISNLSYDDLARKYKISNHQAVTRLMNNLVSKLKNSKTLKRMLIQLSKE